MKDPSHQLPLIVGGTSEPKPKRVTRKQNRAPPVPMCGSGRVAPPSQHELDFFSGYITSVRTHRSLPVIEPVLFMPREGVPATRADCPVQRPCDRIHCRYHLWRIDRDDRAGRPGLSDVPRDDLGRTVSVAGEAGEERAGTTLWPAWLQLDRTCLMRVIRDDQFRIEGVEPVHRRPRESRGSWQWGGGDIGSWDMMRPHIRAGQPLYVFNRTGTEHLAMARLTEDEQLKFDADFGALTIIVANLERRLSSCALDEAAKGRRTNEQVGDAIGRHRTLVAREVRRAAIKVRARGGDLRDVVAK